MFYRCNVFTKLAFKSEWLHFLKLYSPPKNICVGTDEEVRRVQYIVIPQTGIPLHKNIVKLCRKKQKQGRYNLHGHALSCFSSIYTRVCEPCSLDRPQLSLKPTLKIARYCKTPFCALKIGILLIQIKGQIHPLFKYNYSLVVIIIFEHELKGAKVKIVLNNFQ